MAKSPSGSFFAVLINTGLIELLHKYGKLKIAAQLPGSVTYCNRFPLSDVTKETMGALGREYVAHFAHTKRAHGPLVYLDEDASAIHAHRLNIQELFLVGHELGHLLSSRLDKADSDKPFLDYVENPQHRREHAADLFGFALLVATPSPEGPMSDGQRLMLLFAIIDLFDTLCLLHAEASESHPHPLMRLYCIVEHFFGPRYTEIVARSYQDPSALACLADGKHPPIDGVEGTFIPILWVLCDDLLGVDSLTGLVNDVSCVAR